MDFNLNEGLAPMAIEKIKILGASPRNFNGQKQLIWISTSYKWIAPVKQNESSTTFLPFYS